MHKWLHPTVAADNIGMPQVTDIGLHIHVYQMHIQVTRVVYKRWTVSFWFP